MHVYDLDLNLIDTYNLPVNVHDFIVVPGAEGGLQMVAVVSASSYSGRHLASFDESGDLLWELHRDTSRIASLTPIYNEQGVVTSLVIGYGGKEGIRGVSLNGDDLWQVKNRQVLYAVKSHPTIANTFVMVGGQIEIFKVMNGVANTIARSFVSDPYADNIEIFTNIDGYLQIVSTGSERENGVPRITAYDQELAVQWQSAVPRKLQKLAMLELEVTPSAPVFMAATEGGTYFIFEADGTMLYQGRSFPFGGKDSATYWLEGISVGGSSGFFAMVLLTGMGIPLFHIDFN